MRMAADPPGAAVGMKGAAGLLSPLRPCWSVARRPRSATRISGGLIVGYPPARFSGYCPCPYSYDRGEQCAEKSVYSRRIAYPYLYCYPA